MHLIGIDVGTGGSRAVLIDAGTAGSPETVAALGRGDTEPALSATHLAGLSQRPLRPVHGRAGPGLDGALVLSWTRRGRGDWRWVDGTDVPVAEESERYLVTAEREGAVLRSWTRNHQRHAMNAKGIPTRSATANPLPKIGGNKLCSGGSSDFEPTSAFS